MSVVSATSTFTTAETAFKSAVDALPDAATFTEICGCVQNVCLDFFLTNYLYSSDIRFKCPRQDWNFGILKN